MTRSPARANEAARSAPTTADLYAIREIDLRGAAIAASWLVAPIAAFVVGLLVVLP
jgi:hypothetical protein